MESDVIVKHIPPQEIIIHDISVFRTAEDMGRAYTFGRDFCCDKFIWANGVVMNYHKLGSAFSDTYVRELMDGKIHFEWVAVAPMKKYSERIKVEKFVSVHVKDTSYNKKFVELGRYLYDYAQTKIKENDIYPFSEKYEILQMR